MIKKKQIFISIIWFCIFTYAFSFAGNAHAIAGFLTILDETHSINFTKQDNKINFSLNHHNHENELSNKSHNHHKPLNKSNSISTSEEEHLDHEINFFHFNQLASSSAKNLQFKRFVFPILSIIEPYFITQISNNYNNFSPALQKNLSNLSLRTTVLLI